MKKNKPLLFTGLIIFGILVFLASLSIGRYHVSMADTAEAVISKILGTQSDLPGEVFTVIFDIRLPRILLALLVGISLSLAGTVFQGVFRNPLVSPFILGVSSGAGFGIALGLVLGLNLFLVKLLGFGFGIVTVFLASFLGSALYNRSSITMVLSGFVIGSLFSAATSFLKYIADPYTRLPAITFWLMGSFSYAEGGDLKYSALIFIACIIGIFLLRWKLNILAMGEEEARNLGENTGRTGSLFIVLATLLTAISVSLCGIIGWIGLIVPHIGRMLVGPDHRKLVPFSILFGGTFMLIVDDIARTISSIEIPVGILMAIIGAPLFIILLLKKNLHWEE